MSQIQRVFLIGLGAVGGAYAGRIQEHCPGQLKVIVDSRRAKRYTESGITINGKLTSFDYVSPETIKEPADLIIIAVKQHHLEQAIRDIKGLVGLNTIILSLLNGISSEDRIGSVYGMDKMLHSFVVATDSVRTGTNIQYSNIGKIVFGDRDDPAGSSKVQAVRAFFDKAHIPYTIPDDIIREQWWKFMMNVGINQVSAVLRAPYGAFAKPGAARELMFAASREVIAIAEMAGVKLSENDLAQYAAVIESISPLGKTSMLQDVEAGRKTEVEIFAGTVIKLGQQYGVATPVNQLLYQLITAIEEISGNR